MLDGSARKLDLRFAVSPAASADRVRARPQRMFVDGATRSVWVASDGREVATWRVDEQSGMQQRSVMTGRSAASSAVLVCRIGAGEEQAATAVLGRDGSLVVWEGDVCVGKKRAVTTVPPKRACLLSDGLHLASCGSSSDVEIVSLATLAVVLTLPHGHGSWVSVVHAVPALGERLEQRPPVLFSASRDGVAVFWSLDLAAGSALPVASLSLDPANPPLAAAVSRDAKVVAVVFENRVELYKTLKPTLLHVLPVSTGRQWRGCEFVESQRLLVWDDSGHGVVFALPTAYKRLPEPQFGPSSAVPQRNDQLGKRRFQSSPSASDKTEGSGGSKSNPLSLSGFHRIPRGVVFQEREENSSPSPGPEEKHALLNASSGNNNNNTSNTEETAVVTEPTVTTEMELPPGSSQWVDSACSGNVFCSVGGDGDVHAWLLDDTCGSAVLHSSRQTGGKQAASTLLVVMVDETCGVLIEGRETGELCATSFPSGKQLWSLPRAHTGPVSSLYCPPAEESSFGQTASASRDLFVSGGADFRIAVWHALTGVLVHVFAQHAGRVERLVGPPAGGTRWRHCFLSVGSDRTVSLFSLQNYNCQYVFVGHSAAVETIVWRDDQDFLVVGCSDGGVFVWELGTGALLQQGQLARAHEVLSSGPDLMTSFGQAVKRGGGLVCARSHGAAVQVVTVGVRQLLAALAAGGSRASSVMGWAAWLVPWSMLPPDMAAELSARAGMQPTIGGVQCALQGRGKNISVSRAKGQWEASPRLAALHEMGCVALLQRIVRQSEDMAVKSVCTAAVAYICNEVTSAAPPSLALLATHWQDVQEEVMDAARTLLSAVVEHMGVGSLGKCIALYENALTESITTPRFRSLAALVLGAMGGRGVTLDVSLTGKVTEALVYLVLNAPDKTVSLAGAELLGTRGAPIRGSGAEMINQLLERLLRMSLAQQGAGEVAWRALLAVAAAQPDAVLRMLTVSAASPDTSVVETNAMLALLRDLAKSAPGALLPHLGVVVGLAVRPLDPAVTHKRRACLAGATQTLDVLVRRFPMVDFHQTSQRIAVGTAGAQVLVFDVATGGEIARLEGHKGPIAAVSFSPAGSQMASFCMSRGQIKVWTLSGSFFGFGSTPHCIATISVDSGKDARARMATQQQLLEQLELRWQGETSLSLSRAWLGTITFKIK